MSAHVRVALLAALAYATPASAQSEPPSAALGTPVPEASVVHAAPRGARTLTQEQALRPLVATGTVFCAVGYLQAVGTGIFFYVFSGGYGVHLVNLVPVAGPVITMVFSPNMWSIIAGVIQLGLQVAGLAMVIGGGLGRRDVPVREGVRVAAGPGDAGLGVAWSF